MLSQVDCLSPLHFVVLEFHSFIWNIFLCHLILPTFLCLWEPFLRIQHCNSWFSHALVGEDDPGACAGFPVGGTGACPLLGGLDIVRLVARLCHGICLETTFRLKTTLGSLSANVWGCVPTLGLFGLNAPALEPEGCQCGQFPMSKWWPLWELMSMNIPWGICHQCPCLHGKLQLTLVSPGDPLRPTGKSGSSFYGVIALPWVPVHWNLVCTLQEWSLWLSDFPFHGGDPGKLFSSLWVSNLAGMGFDSVVKVALLLSHCGCFFVFGCRISFLVGVSLFCQWLFSS